VKQRATPKAKKEAAGKMVMLSEEELAMLETIRKSKKN